MGRYRRFLIVKLILIIALVAGCGGQEQRKPMPPPTKIAVSMADMEWDGNKMIREVMDERKQNENLDISFMDAKTDPAEQEKHIDKMIEEETEAAIIQFIDLNAATEMVKKLKEEDIKVVALHNLPYNTPVDGFVAPDYTRAGNLQERFAREAMEMFSRAQQGGGQQEEGEEQQDMTTQVTQAVDPASAFQLPQERPLKVLILKGDKKDRAASEITSANINAVKDNPDLELLKVQEHPQYDPAQVTSALAEMLANDNQPDVVLANDSNLAMAAVQFLKEAGLEKEVLTVGMGANEDASIALVSGDHDGEVDPNPEMLAQYSLSAAKGLAENDHWQFDRQIYNGDYNIPAKIVPVRLIGKNNAYLLQERWEEVRKMLEQEQEQQPQGGGGGQQEASQGGENGQGGGGGTTLKITTEEGKVMEMNIDGKIQKIESQEGQGGEEGGGGE